jgi:aminotransferase
VVSQYAAMGALEMGDKDVAKFNEQYADRRGLICARLDKLSHVFSYVYPESCYYVFPRIRDKYLRQTAERGASWDFALRLLDDIHVATVPGSAFGPNGENHIRLSFGRETKDIQEAFDRMDKYFAS